MKFYFDFCDFRSYLLSKQLASLEDLPISVQWIPVDAYSLRALSGENAGLVSEAGRRYLRQRAERFARLQKIPFHWRENAGSSGLALRICYWLMKEGVDLSALSAVLLERIWGDGRNMDADEINECLHLTLPEAGDVLSASAGKNTFEWQDICLKRALAEGVFDVPALVVGERCFWGYEDISEIRHYLLGKILQSADYSHVLDALNEYLSSLPPAGLKRWLDRLIENDGEEMAEVVPPVRMPFSRQLQCPSDKRDIEISFTESPLVVNFISGTLEDAWLASRPEGLNLYVGNTPAAGEITDFSQFIKRHPKPGREFVTCVQYPSGYGAFCANSNDNSAIESENRIFDTNSLSIPMLSSGKWKLGCLWGFSPSDGQLARLGAASGAHLLVYFSTPGRSFELASAAVVTRRCVVGIGEEVTVVDKCGNIISLNVTKEKICSIKMPSDGILDGARQWMPDLPRTVLLTEEGLMLGSLKVGGHLELACVGSSLMLRAERQQNLLSESRFFERMTLPVGTVCIVPLKEEQIMVSELVHFKLLDAFSRCASEARLIFVNYWRSLSEKALAEVRPVLATLEEIWHIPVVLVSGEIIVDVWASNSQGVVYRIERSDGVYALDVADIPFSQECLNGAMERLDTNETIFCERLKKITEILKK